MTTLNWVMNTYCIRCLIKSHLLGNMHILECLGRVQTLHYCCMRMKCFVRESGLIASYSFSHSQNSFVPVGHYTVHACLIYPMLLHQKEYFGRISTAEACSTLKFTSSYAYVHSLEDRKVISVALLLS